MCILVIRFIHHLTNSISYICFQISSMLLDKIKRYIKQEKLLHHSSKILVGVSGGSDSMVLLEILYQLNYSCSVAHMNFSLRGNESDEDEAFVRDYALQNNLPFYSKKVDTLMYAKSHGISMEMAARDLRYAFFDELLQSHKLDIIALGHHKNDLVETMLINLARGTGVRGLSGIQAKTGKLVRPLLEITNEEIIAYAESHNILYRNDSTNADTHIQRNNFRHNIIPRFEEINPSFIQTIANTAHRMQEVQQLINNTVSHFIAAYVHDEKDKKYIQLDGLLKHPSKAIVLFEILNSFGFNASQLDEINIALGKEPGKTWHSKAYRLILSSTHLILTKKVTEPGTEKILILENMQKISKPIRLTISDKIPVQNCTLNFTKEDAYFDAEKIRFPLTIRKWEHGDWFVPFGMTGRKKLSDFFIDNKLSLDKKEEVYVLLSEEDIIWIPGYRTDNRYKITEETQSVIHMNHRKNDH